MPRFLCSLLAFSATSSTVITLEAGDEIDFNRDIRPALSDNCYYCHGPDGSFLYPEEQVAVLSNTPTWKRDNPILKVKQSLEQNPI